MFGGVAVALQIMHFPSPVSMISHTVFLQFACIDFERIRLPVFVTVSTVFLPNFACGTNERFKEDKLKVIFAI